MGMRVLPPLAVIVLSLLLARLAADAARGAAQRSATGDALAAAPLALCALLLLGAMVAVLRPTVLLLWHAGRIRSHGRAHSP